MKARLKALLRDRGIAAAAADDGADLPAAAGRRREGHGSRRRRGPGPAAAPRDGVVRVGRETKGRKGKVVTVVTGVPVAGAELAELARSLKNLCGAGGTVRGDVIEVQGDHRERIATALAQKGWTVKRAGG